MEKAYIEGLGRRAALAAALPLALQVLARTVGERSIRLAYERGLSLLLWNDVLRLLKVSHRDELEPRARKTWQARPRIPMNAQTRSRIDLLFVATTYHNELQLVLDATNC